MRLFSALLPPRAGICLAVLATVASLPSFTRAQDTSPASLKAQADRWVELEQRIAEEQNKWKADKEVLLTSRDVLLKEREALLAKTEANEVAINLFRQRLENTNTAIGEHREARSRLAAAYDEMEARIHKLATSLPPPLKEKVDAMLELLEPGTEDDPTPVSQRTQAITGILSAIDQFNNTLTLTHELRPDDSGDVRDIKVLYWGLAMAYAADSAGDGAWLVTPSPDGWVWHDAGDDAASIATLLDVYEKGRSPELVVLPIKPKGVMP